MECRRCGRSVSWVSKVVDGVSKSVDGVSKFVGGVSQIGAFDNGQCWSVE